MHTVYRPKCCKMKMHVHTLKLQKRLPAVLGGNELRYDVTDVNCISTGDYANALSRRLFTAISRLAWHLQQINGARHLAYQASHGPLV